MLTISFDPRLPLHLVAILVLAGVFLAFYWGKSSDTRARRKEQERIWQKRRDELPKAISRATGKRSTV